MSEPVPTTPPAVAPEAAPHAMSSLAKRVLVAIVGIPFILLITWVGGWPFTLLAFTILLGACGEFAALWPEVDDWANFGPAIGVALVLISSHAPSSDVPVWLGIATGAFVIVGAATLTWRYAPLTRFPAQMVTGLFVAPITAVGFWTESVPSSTVHMSLGLIVLVAMAVRLFVRHDVRGAAHRMGLLSLTVLYLLLPIALWMDLRNGPNGRALCLFAFAVVWSTDTTAFFTGRAIGRHPFSPISPKKTWEGTIGGIVGGGVCGLVAGLLSDAMPLEEWVAMGFVMSLLAILGDLFESALKRDAGVKDSGTLLPGHGGVLDRFDSLLFAAPAIWVWVQWANAKIP